MEALRHSINFDLSHDLPPLDTYAQKILENSKTILTATPTTVPSITLNAFSTTTSTQLNSSNDILQKIGATLLNSIQLKKYMKIDNSPIVGNSLGASDDSMNVYGISSPPHHVVIDSSGFEAMDELQRQLEYDKFMNEVWIGVVLTLVLISMVFCICSCFLYHQFRAWKRNYRSTITQSLNGLESETRKLYPDIDDPVPEYTLVSGLPSYEAALELLNKTPKSCLIVHPSVFNVFHVNEKNTDEQEKQQQQQHRTQQTPQSQLVEVTTPLLPATQNQTTTATTNIVMAGKAYALLPTYEEANCQNNLLCSANVTLTAVNEKSTIIPIELTTNEKKHNTAALMTTNSVTAIPTAMVVEQTTETTTISSR